MYKRPSFNPFEDDFLDNVSDGVMSYYVNKHLALDRGETENRAERSAMFLGALGTLSSASNSYANQRRRMEGLARQQEKEYYRIPHYNDYHYQSVNPYNTSAFQEGGALPEEFNYDQAYDDFFNESPQEAQYSVYPMDVQEEGDDFLVHPDDLYHAQQDSYSQLLGEMFPGLDPTFSDRPDYLDSFVYSEFGTDNMEDFFNMGQQTTPEGGFSTSSSGLHISPVVNKLEELGIKTGSINTGTHNVGSKHYTGKAVDLPASTNGGADGLRAIYNFLNSPEGKAYFPNIRVHDEISKPAGQRVWSGSHLHIEMD